MPHAVVIGSGFGGLAAALRLLARGWRVTVLERLPDLGGRARVHVQDGHTFDAGPTIITAPFLLEELWALHGRRLQDDVTLQPVTPFYRIRFDDGAVFDYTGDAAAMRAEVARFSPNDVAGYERFMTKAEAIFRVGFEQLGDVPFGSLADMARVLPHMLRLGSFRSVHALVSRHIRDPRLRAVFSFHPLLVGGNPFTASSIYSLICFLERRWGVHFAQGGTGRIIAAMARLIEAESGTVRTRADVTRILVERGHVAGVALADGETVAADIVVSNADVAATYGTLMRGRPRRRWTDRRLARARQSMGLFVWYFGTTRRYADVAHHTILLGPRYRDLLADIFIHHRLAEDFSLYLHRPTATDTSLAPPGRDTFYVLSPVPNLASATDWRIAAEPYRKAIETALAETLLPGLPDAIATSRIATPETFRDDFAAAAGAGFGMEPLLRQSAWFRPHNESEDLPGLYLVGAGTHPGAGVPGVLSSARVLDRLIPRAEHWRGPNSCTTAQSS